MEEWSVRDDRPQYYRPEESSHAAWLVPAVVIVLVVGAAAAFAWWQMRGPMGWSVPEETPPPAVQAAAEPVPAPAPEPKTPEIKHPLPAPEPQAAKATALPTLDMSDSMARDVLAGLLGRKTFAELVLPTQLVRRIVATVDNLPRETVPQRMMPLKQVPGAFDTAGSGEETVLDAGNFARYASYVKALESLDAGGLVSGYVQAYPLFQSAYRELGYPAGNFNDRLIEAIDDMLAAPEVQGPVKLLRPKVFYEFADPDLETLSAGQKVMVRMGSANAARVKAKLREIRQAIIAASQPRP